MNKTVGFFRVALIKPTKRVISRVPIKATDRAWRTAIFGMGGGRKRLGGVRLGSLGISRVALICELPSEVAPNTPVWTIRTDLGLFAIAGPAALYNDIGFGPATLTATEEEVRSAINFDPDPAEMAAGLQATLTARDPDA